MPCADQVQCAVESLPKANGSLVERLQHGVSRASLLVTAHNRENVGVHVAQLDRDVETAPASAQWLKLINAVHFRWFGSGLCSFLARSIFSQLVAVDHSLSCRTRLHMFRYHVVILLDCYKSPLRAEARFVKLLLLRRWQQLSVLVSDRQVYRACHTDHADHTMVPLPRAEQGHGSQAAPGSQTPLGEWSAAC